MAARTRVGKERVGSLGLGVLEGRATPFADAVDVKSKRKGRVQHGSSYGSGLSDGMDGVSLTEWPMGEK